MVPTVTINWQASVAIAVAEPWAKLGFVSRQLPCPSRETRELFLDHPDMVTVGTIVRAVTAD
jgi:hypothetical protein